MIIFAVFFSPVEKFVSQSNFKQTIDSFPIPSHFRSFSAQQAKQVRVSVNAFLESIILCTETMQQFGPPAATYDYE